jgi:hypothetical protein
MDSAMYLKTATVYLVATAVYLVADAVCLMKTALNPEAYTLYLVVVAAVYLVAAEM